MRAAPGQLKNPITNTIFTNPVPNKAAMTIAKRKRGMTWNTSAPESFTGPNAGLTEVLVPAGYVTTVYDPTFVLNETGTRYVSKASQRPTSIPEPGLPFSLVFRAEPGKEDILLKIASTYEAASRRRIPSPAFGPLPPKARARRPAQLEVGGVSQSLR
jgi:hypothetical protein